MSILEQYVKFIVESSIQPPPKLTKEIVDWIFGLLCGYAFSRPEIVKDIPEDHLNFCPEQSNEKINPRKIYEKIFSMNVDNWRYFDDPRFKDTNVENLKIMVHAVFGESINKKDKNKKILAAFYGIGRRPTIKISIPYKFHGADFPYILASLDNSVKHELIHLTQEILSIVFSDNRQVVAGIPRKLSKNSLTPNTAQSLNATDSEVYHLHPMEFYPWLQDAKRTALRIFNELDEDERVSYFREFVGIDENLFEPESMYTAWFNNLKKYDRKLWDKAVKELYKTLKTKNLLP